MVFLGIMFPLLWSEWGEIKWRHKMHKIRFLFRPRGKQIPFEEFTIISKFGSKSSNI